MTDDARFAEAVESCTLPPESFTHRAHVRLAWIYARALPYPLALQRIERTISRYAASLGAAPKFHRTITAAWLTLVAAAEAETPGIDRFDAFIEAHPDLLGRDALGRHYSAGRLASPAARADVIAPDLAPLPAVGAGAGLDDTPRQAAGAGRSLSGFPALAVYSGGHWNRLEGQMAERIQISSKEARKALQKLIDELDGADLSLLAEAVANRHKRIQQVSQWKEALRTTIRDIEEWCPSGSFTIDAEPRRQRT